MKDEIMQRMKDNYEMRTRTYLPRRSNVIIRLDGKAFHTYTRGLITPFDKDFADDMDETARFLCENIQGAKCAYVQSDEISILITDFDKITSQAWFNYQIQKMVSISAAMATAKFNQLRMVRSMSEKENMNIPVESEFYKKFKTAFFDSRVFSIPDSIEVHNYFVARQNDATKNSISMAAQSMFSHNSLIGMNGNEMQERMFQEKGVNWDKYPVRFKRGGFVKRVKYTVDVDRTNIPDWVDIPETTERSKWSIIDPPIFTQDLECTYSCIPIRVAGQAATLWDVYEDELNINENKTENEKV